MKANILRTGALFLTWYAGVVAVVECYGFTWTAPQKAWLLIGSEKLLNYEDLTSFKD